MPGFDDRLSNKKQEVGRDKQNQKQGETQLERDKSGVNQKKTELIPKNHKKKKTHRY